MQPPAALRRSVRRRQAPATSLVLEVWLLLGGECGHARLLVVRREGGVEDRALEAQALGERRLEGDVDAPAGVKGRGVKSIGVKGRVAQRVWRAEVRRAEV